MSKEELKNYIVPWKNPDEFMKVYKYAYSDDLAKNRCAVEQMAVWETRCWPSLPSAVEVTLLFVRSKIQDQLYEANKSLCHAQEVEMMYANSVVRFVNLMVENDQNSRIKKRMSYVAVEKNIPPWIVEIRHSAAHGFNPTLPVLRMAYETIMAYLDESFWQKESSRIKCIKKTIDETPMMELWQDYIAKQYQVVVYRNDVSEKKKFMPAANKVLRKMDLILKKPQSRKTLLNVIVRDFVTEDIIPLVEDDKLLYDADMISVSTLPEPLQHFYNPVIHLLHKHNLISTLSELLLLSQEHRQIRILQTIVDLAVLHILDLATAKDKKLDALKPFALKGVNLNRFRMLYSCVKGCSNSARLVFERLVSDLELVAWAEDLSAMMNIKQGKYIDRYEPGRMRNQRQKRKFDITFTTEDLEEDIHEAMEKSNLKTKKKPWFLAPLSINWASLPMGHVFNPVDVTVKEEAKHEGEASTQEISENMYAHACEESEPVKETRPTKFIFKEYPSFSSMIYQEGEC